MSSVSIQINQDSDKIISRQWKTLEPIKFQNKQELLKYINFIDTLRVHPSDFKMTPDMDQKGVDDQFHRGVAIHCLPDLAKCELHLQADGGFVVAKTHYSNGHLCVTRPIGHLLNNGIFNKNFAKTNPDFELLVTETNLAGETAEHTINLSYYHSPTGEAKRIQERKTELEAIAVEMENQLNQIHTEINECTRRLRELPSAEDLKGSELPF